MSRYEEIEAFVRTVDAGSFTAAANQLRVAKSAISRRIQELEQRLGAQLLIRSTRRLSLTEAGRALYERSVTLLADWDEAENVIAKEQTALSGHIRLAAPLSFGVTHLGTALLAFMKQYPNVTFDIDFNDRKVDLISEGVDIAVRIGDLPDSSLIARRLATIKTVVAASPAYIAPYGMPKTPDDLRAMTELRYGYRNKIGWRFSGPEGSTHEIEVNSTLRATNGDFLRDAAVLGQGLVIEPTFILYEDLKAGRLVHLLPDYTLPQIAAYAVYPPTRHLSARVRALVDYLAEHCGGAEPYWDNWG